MCTVSFVNSGGKVIITSNRDEKILRPQALAPKTYTINHKRVLFPKDPRAGGTWFAVDEYSNVLVLLNGAAERHLQKDSYRKSRGLIVLDIIGQDSPFQAWSTLDLTGIEPFTLVLYENHKLFQLRWDEIEKSTLELATTQNHIWSSATLYSPEIRQERARWFATFLDTKPAVNEAEMFYFHRYTESENTTHGLVINRNHVVKTVSITQTVIEQNRVSNHHMDLLSEQEFNTVFITV